MGGNLQHICLAMECGAQTVTSEFWDGMIQAMSSLLPFEHLKRFEVVLELRESYFTQQQTHCTAIEGIDVYLRKMAKTRPTVVFNVSWGRDNLTNEQEALEHGCILTSIFTREVEETVNRFTEYN